MVDINLLVAELRSKGHAVGHVEVLAPNAGDYQIMVDGKNINLEEARALLEADTAE